MASSLRAQLEDDAAHDWDVTPKIALAVFLAPFVGAAAVVLARADKSFFRFLTREDSLLEWAQFVGFAAAGVLAALAGRRLLAQERRRVLRDRRRGDRLGPAPFRLRHPGAARGDQRAAGSSSPSSASTAPWAHGFCDYGGLDGPCDRTSIS